VSKARLVITAVVMEGRRPAEVARTYGVARSWVYELIARYRAEGDRAFEPRSRRPRRSPATIEPSVVELIVRLRKELVAEGLDAGAATIAWHLEHAHDVHVSRATIYRHLRAGGLIAPTPKKRPRASYIRFQAEQPNECWQADFTHVRLADGTDIEVLCWLDDHSRYVLSITTHDRVTGPIVLRVFRDCIDRYGPPTSTLTDNGMVFTARLAGGRGGRNAFETELARLGITQKNSRPNHPTTCGKVERLHQTLKQWLRARPAPTTITELQAQLDRFDHQRPHRSLPRHTTPAATYNARPKATPTGRPNTHYRIRHDRIDDTGVVTLRVNGRLHHIGIGRTHAGTTVTVLIAGRDIRVLTEHGQLIRQLELDPTRDYQPQNP
jgi:transposase InsO family protein